MDVLDVCPLLLPQNSTATVYDGVIKVAVCRETDIVLFTVWNPTTLVDTTSSDCITILCDEFYVIYVGGGMPIQFLDLWKHLTGHIFLGGGGQASFRSKNIHFIRWLTG